MENQNSKTILTVPVAVIVAGILIAGAVFFSRLDNREQVNIETDKNTKTTLLEKMYPINEKDHILGNPDAPIKIVEYSDAECPFCKVFHNTMHQIMNEYGKSGQVAWIYRHFPIDDRHPIKARKEAVASECVNQIGGNIAFWKFIDRFFELTPSNNQTDIEVVIPQIVKELGINETTFNSCYNSDKYDEHIENDFQNAVQTGGRGTPWSIVVAPNGKTFPIDGAQPISVVKQIIEVALQEK